MPLSRRDRAGLVAVVFLTAATHATYFVCSSDYYYPDSATYMVPATTLSERGFFGEDAETPETMRTPGYPLVLAAFDRFTSSPDPVILMQHALSCLVDAALYLLALRESGRRRIAVTASLILALDILTIHYANKVLTETLFTVVLIGVVALSLRLARSPSTAGFVGLGLLTGVLVMVRPVAIAYCGVLALFFTLVAAADSRDRASTLRTTATFLVAALVIPTGWALRNRRETGVFTVASIAGTNLLLYRAAGVLAIGDAEDFSTSLDRRQKELETAVGAAIRKDDGVEPDELPHAVLAERYSRAARPLILAHPGSYALLAGRGLLHNILETDWDALAMVSRLPTPLIQWGMRVLTAFLFPAAAFGLLVLAHRSRNLAILIALTCAYFLLVSAGGESEARFRLPIVPLYALAAAAGIDRVVGRLRVLRT